MNFKKTFFRWFTFVAMFCSQTAHATDQHSLISLSSYQNTKSYPLFHNTFPLNNSKRDYLYDHSSVFFTHSDGSPRLLVYSLTYRFNKPIEEATEAKPLFFKLVDGEWREVLMAINKKAKHCLHPRKAIPADFNKDGFLDFVFACHGYDKPPFPGEKSVIFLSSGPDSYDFNVIEDRIEFSHGGSSHDFNEDGYPDLVLANRGLQLYLNNQKGEFERSNSFSLPSMRGVYHVELVDVNGDKKFDLIAGGHEHEGRSIIALNPGSNKFGFFSGAKTIEIPKLTHAGVITDFIFSPANKSLIVLRTGDGQSTDSTFYQGLWIQKVNIETGEAKLIFADKNWKDTRSLKGWKDTWLTWAREKNGLVVTNWGNKFSVSIN